MRKIIAYLATSADGFIARPNGAVDWLDRPRVPGDYGMARFYRTVDTMVMGRKTWDVGRKLGARIDAAKTTYVFSRKRRRSAVPGVVFVDEPIPRFAQRLRHARGKHIWLMGGADLLAGFLDADQLDELIINVVPSLIGAGIPLLAPRRRIVPLRLVACRRFTDGVVRLHYLIERSAPTRGSSSPSRRSRPSRP